MTSYGPDGGRPTMVARLCELLMGGRASNRNALDVTVVHGATPDIGGHLMPDEGCRSQPFLANWLRANPWGCHDPSASRRRHPS